MKVESEDAAERALCTTPLEAQDGGKTYRTVGAKAPEADMKLTKTALKRMNEIALGYMHPPTHPPVRCPPSA